MKSSGFVSRNHPLIAFKDSLGKATWLQEMKDVTSSLQLVETRWPCWHMIQHYSVIFEEAWMISHTYAWICHTSHGYVWILCAGTAQSCKQINHRTLSCWWIRSNNVGSYSLHILMHDTSCQMSCVSLNCRCIFVSYLFIGTSSAFHFRVVIRLCLLL